MSRLSQTMKNNVIAGSNTLGRPSTKRKLDRDVRLRKSPHYVSPEQGTPHMTTRFKISFATLAVATLFTFGATNQASAFDLLEELLGGTKYAAGDCGCSQKASGHVQRCGSDCGGKGISEHAQRSGGKGLGGHVQHSKGGKGFGGHVQHATCGRCGKGSCDCGRKGGHVQHSGRKGGGKGDSKGGSKGSRFHVDLLGMMQAKMGSLKCKLSSHDCDCSCGCDQGYDVDFKAGGFGDGKSMMVPAPVISDGPETLAVPVDPDPST